MSHNKLASHVSSFSHVGLVSSKPCCNWEALCAMTRRQKGLNMIVHGKGVRVVLGRVFLIIDGVGLHAGVRGARTRSGKAFEIAYVRGYGWALG